MGGIPTNRFGQVVTTKDGNPEQVIPGLYAVGECACVSVHGANRLGGNSLLDILVFGRAAANHISGYLKEHRYHRELNDASVEQALARLARWDKDNGSSGEERVGVVRRDLQRVMEQHCSVFRNEEVMREGIEKLRVIQERINNICLQDDSRAFNTARIEALELENMADIAMATLLSAVARLESRGAHSRADYPERDDENWRKHSLYFQDGERMEWKPVRNQPLSVDSFPPIERVY
jgi:succinate dehydrogenase / fumarate reductase flavoprotein subunit